MSIGYLIFFIFCLVLLAFACFCLWEGWGMFGLLVINVTILMLILGGYKGFSFNEADITINKNSFIEIKEDVVYLKVVNDGAVESKGYPLTLVTFFESVDDRGFTRQKPALKAVEIVLPSVEYEKFQAELGL